MPYRAQQPLTAALARALHPKYWVLSMDRQACRPIAQTISAMSDSTFNPYKNPSKPGRSYPEVP